MSWLQVKLVVPGTFADELSDLCLEVGAVSAVLDNAGADSLAEAVLEPDPGATIVWKRAVITAFWPATSDLASISSVLANHIHDKSIFAEVTVDFIADSELAGAAPQQVAELSFGDGRLWLIPRGAEPRAQDAAPCIKLDPGLAFGSGLHPTTQLCLDYMARMSGWKGLRLLDFGCGSGVLALGALALGAREAHGVDHDPQALVATQDNAAYNDLGDAMQVFTPAELPDNAHYEVVVANILANPLIELAGSKEVGDEIFTEIQYPTAHRLLTKCDDILRIKGDSKGADQDVKIAKELGLKVYYTLDEIPEVIINL